MKQADKSTTIVDTGLGSGPNFEPQDPMGAEVKVTARNTDGNNNTFIVQTSDCRFRPGMGCGIIDQANGEDIDREHPLFDMEVIIEAAESFMDDHADIVDTGVSTKQNEAVGLVKTPFQVHVVIENRDYVNKHVSTSQPRFRKTMGTFETEEDATLFVDRRVDWSKTTH